MQQGLVISLQILKPISVCLTQGVTASKRRRFNLGVCF